MFPIALDLTKIPILLIGKGEAFERRHKQLLEYGATKLSLSNNQQPATSNYDDAVIVMIAGLSRHESEQLSTSARAAGKLINVEDMNDLCDFYFTANVKRGDLVIAVSTGGASPTLSRKIRDYIAGIFDAQWENRVVEIADFRKKLKAEGKTIPEVMVACEKLLAEKGWLK